MLENTIRIFYEIVMSNYNGIADNIIFIDVNDLMTDEVIPDTNEQLERYCKKNYFYQEKNAKKRKNNYNFVLSRFICYFYLNIYTHILFMRVFSINKYI